MYNMHNTDNGEDGILTHLSAMLGVYESGWGTRACSGGGVCYGQCGNANTADCHDLKREKGDMNFRCVYASYLMDPFVDSPTDKTKRVCLRIFMRRVSRVSCMRGGAAACIAVGSSQWGLKEGRGDGVDSFLAVCVCAVLGSWLIIIYFTTGVLGNLGSFNHSSAGSGVKMNDKRNDKKHDFPQVQDPEMDWDNFFPYVEFCDSGSEGDSITTSTTQPDAGKGGNDGKSSNVDYPAVKPALCTPLELSPPPASSDPDAAVFRKPSKVAKLFRNAKKRIENAVGNRGENTGLQRRKNDAMIGGQASGTGDHEEGDSDLERERVPASSATRRRSRSLEKRDPRDLILGQFSITDAVAEADERDFRAPRSRRAISKPDVRDPGPMLSSTIDEDSDSVIDPDDSDIVQLRGVGNKNKSESLKESFKRRGGSGRVSDDLRERAENDRKDRRKDRFDTMRDLPKEQNGTPSPVRHPHLSGNSEIREEVQSPIITSRRGLTLQNWADMTTGSGYSVRSDGNATVSGPRRKTRRGKRKRRNLSASNTNVSLTESFKETLFTEGALEISGESCTSMTSKSGGSGKCAGIELGTARSSTEDAKAGRTVAMQGSRSMVRKKDGLSALRLASTPRRTDACPVLSRVSELVRAGNPYGNQDGVWDLDDSRVEEVDLGYTVQRRKADHEPLLDSTQEIDLNNLLPTNCRRLAGGQKIRSKGVIQFVILRRPDGSDDEYEVFPRKALENLINNVEGKNAASANGLSAAFKFPNMWGEIPLLGLYSADLSLLAGYRFQIELYSDGYEYQTFPREALDRRLALTMMLWQNLETSWTEIPGCLAELKWPDLKFSAPPTWMHERIVC